MTAGEAETVVHRNYIKESLSYEASLCCSSTNSSISNLPPNMTLEDKRFLPQSDTVVVDFGANHLYISLTALHEPPNTSTTKISVGTDNSHVERSLVTASLTILQLAEDFQL